MKNLIRNNDNNILGHGAAIFSIVVWGTTFISTKVLLRSFSPVEILFLRFVIGYLALWVAQPKPIRGTDWRQELTYAAAGLSGVTFYFLLENMALTYTMASNVSLIISAAPFFTALLTRLVSKEEGRLRPTFFVGFALAMAGIALISLNSTQLSLNPLGDLLALLAALMWAVYGVATRHIGTYGHSTVQTTRRIFFYGLLFMIPALFWMDFHPDWPLLLRPINWGNLLFLGLGASALCFAAWNFAVKVVGTVRTTAYIYMTPVVTVAASALLLGEPVTYLSVLGVLLTLTGLFLSERHE